MIDAGWIKRHIKAGNIAPCEGNTCTDPRWPPEHRTRTLWSGVIDGFQVMFYPKGREIDMSTVRVSSARTLSHRERNDA